MQHWLEERQATFKLDSVFVEGFAGAPVDWGYEDLAGRSSMGEIVFYRTYSRLKTDGSKERWHEVCARVIEGMYSIIAGHCAASHLPWDPEEAQAEAQDAYRRLHAMKWMPPGRGLWMMGTEFVHHKGGGAALNNCAFVSTSAMSADAPERPFAFLMEAAMLGIGVGFDTDGAQLGLRLWEPRPGGIFRIEDSRESWVASVSALLRAFLVRREALPTFDYSAIRPGGSRIAGFGGVAPGPAPLRELHEALVSLLSGREGEALSSRDIVDVGNLIGRCVVTGNVRRVAGMAIGAAGDEDFLDLKDYEVNPERAAWGWTSNNTVRVEVDDDYSHVLARAVQTGEPGLLFTDLSQNFGRLADAPDGRDRRATGTNPCAEQSLEPWECCCLVEVFPTKCDDRDDFLETLRQAFRYAKAVTLLPTPWPQSNAVMRRNRRIGCSLSGLAEFVEHRGSDQLREWLDQGYEQVRSCDVEVSESWGIRESIKVTSIKPSGSVSLLAGVAPGVHWPPGAAYIRRIRFSRRDPLGQALAAAGYSAEPALDEPGTVVVEIPIRGPEIRGDREVPVREKIALASLLQRHWADNAVSLTVTFDPESESELLREELLSQSGKLKAVSVLPHVDSGFAQLPYEPLDPAARKELEEMRIDPLPWAALYEGKRALDAEGEVFCGADLCETAAPEAVVR